MRRQPLSIALFPALILAAGAWPAIPSALAGSSSPWKSCVRVFAPTPTLGEIPIYQVCESRELPGGDSRLRAFGFFQGTESGVPGRAFLASLNTGSGGDCSEGGDQPHCRIERWESLQVLDAEALSRGEIRELGPDSRKRAWTFAPGAFTRPLSRRGIVTIEAPPRDLPDAPARRADARWEKLGPKARRALLRGPASQSPQALEEKLSARTLASAASPEGCWEIPLVAVTPVKRTTPLNSAEWHRKGVACDGRSGEACTHVTLEQKIEPSVAIRGALKLVHSQGGAEIERSFLPLLRSPAIRDLLKLRKFAREQAGEKDLCRPIPIAVAKPGQELGIGPALINGMTFELDGRRYDELIAIENAVLAGQKILSMEALKQQGIDDLVIAHELAHGMMQDLYGTDDFAQVTAGIVSRDGHNASATTDPALAWVEGFAEAFEAHYGLKHGDEKIDPTYAPLLESALDFIDSGTREMAKHDDFSLPYYMSFVGAVLGKAGEFYGKFDQLMAELLKLERQDPIRNAFYVVSNRFGNLPVQLGHASPMLAPDHVVQSYEELASREGLVAHLVYVLLHSGHERELVSVIGSEKPSNLVDFLNAFARRQPRVWRESGLANRVAQLLDAPTRTAIANELTGPLSPAPFRALGTPQTDAPWLVSLSFGQNGATTEPTMPLPPLRSGWIEYKNPSKIRSFMQGSMDRIDLFTAPIERLVEAFGVGLSTSVASEDQRNSAAMRLASSWLDYRRKLVPESLETRRLGGAAFGIVRDAELEDWAKSAPAVSEQILRRRISGFLMGAQECYFKGCETPEI